MADERDDDGGHDAARGAGDGVDARAGDEALNDRMCIVSRERLEAERLIRFVVAPDGSVVPDLKRKLPGRGAHVEATRVAVELAVRRGAFKRAFKGEGKAGDDLPGLVETVMARSALGALGLARKAGQLLTGAAKVEAELRAGRAIALVQAGDASPDGLRKMDGARLAAAASGRAGHIPVFRPFTSEELGLALGGANVVHAAVLAGNAGAAVLGRLRALEHYRGDLPSGSGPVDGRRTEASSATTNWNGAGGRAEPRTDEAPGRPFGQEAEV